MSRFLLDTNALISLLNQTEDRVLRVVERHRREDIFTSSIVIHELCYGAYKSSAPAKNLKLIERIDLTILQFEAGDAREAGRVRALLGMQGKPIGPYDLLIAGQALARNLVVVTENVREFSRVPGLVCEDWSG